MVERRVAKEIEKVREKFDVECVDDNIMKWHIALQGPDHTPYFGGTFLVQLDFPNDYPFHGPKVKFHTKIYHPNINHKGDVCMGIIDNEWIPSHTALIVMNGLVSLLENPNPNDPLVPEIASIIKRDKKKFIIVAEEWTHTYAM